MKFSELLNNELYNKGNNFKEKEGTIKFEIDKEKNNIDYSEPNYEVEKDEEQKKQEKEAEKQKKDMKFNLYFNKE
jgi:hypothetical protein